MNTKDFSPVRYDFETIFRKQKEIKFLYEPEAKAIFEKFDIDAYEDQEVFKKYCWRITEELMEALEDRKNEAHFKEELVDGFNFLIELYLLYGWGFKDLPRRIQLDFYSIEEKILRVVYQLGITANLLKNRQWRQSQYLVDLYRFEPRFKEIWGYYLNIFYYIGMNLNEIKELWSLKYQVNLFRIKSKY